MENRHHIDLDSLKIKNERPNFLTVLCIFTFIISGIYILMGLLGSFPADQELQIELVEEQIIKFESDMASSGAPMEAGTLEDMRVFLMDRVYNSQTIGLIILLSGILSLLGALFMYRMNKIGFHLYVASKLIGWSSIFIYSTISGMVIGFFAVPAIFTIAFIIMYATNLKHLKKA